MAILSYYNEYDGSDYYDPYAAYYGLLTTEPTYVEPAPYVAPYVAPTTTVDSYVAPTPYVAPYVAPSVAPTPELVAAPSPYVAPEPYVAPYVAPEPYVAPQPPYVAPYVEPYVAPPPVAPAYVDSGLTPSSYFNEREPLLPADYWSQPVSAPVAPPPAEPLLPADYWSQPAPTPAAPPPAEPFLPVDYWAPTSLLDAGTQVPQVQPTTATITAPTTTTPTTTTPATITPTTPTTAPTTAQPLSYYENLLADNVSGGQQAIYGPNSVGWSALPGYEAFWRPATGAGDSWEPESINQPALLQFLDEKGYTVKNQSLPNNYVSNWVVDAAGNEVPGSRVTYQEQNQSLWDVIKEAAPLAAIMGTAYLGGTALAGAGSGTAAGTAALPGISGADAAYALGMGETAAGGGLLSGTAGTVASTLAPEVAASTLAPEAASLLSSAPLTAAPQVIPITAAAPIAAPSLLPPALAATVAAAPVINALTSTPDASYSNEGRTPSEPRANMGGPGTPTVPTVNVAPSPWDQFTAWAKANPQMAKMLFTGAGSLLSASGGSSSGAPAYKDSGYRPTISRGGWQPAVTAQRLQTMPTTPLSLNLPRTGQPNSGLWRYGLLGG